MECHKSYKLCIKRTLANKTLQLLEALVLGLEIKGSVQLVGVIVVNGSSYRRYQRLWWR